MSAATEAPRVPVQAALLTPPGRGGVAVVAVSGPGAAALLEPLFRGRIAPAAMEPGTVAVGRLVADGDVVDEVVLVRVAGESATLGGQRFEVGCHGGPAVVRRILAALVAAGAVPGEPVALALPPDASPVAGETLALLEHATTDLAARILLGGLSGALERHVATLAARAGSLLLPSNPITVERSLVADLEALLATAPLGLACASPPRVALLGLPNAGKSTLWNALLGAERAIVSPEPGTTRDALEETVSLDGVPVRLLDLAGVRATEDAVEREGVARSRAVAASAAVVLAVVDLSVAPDEGTRALLASLPVTSAEQESVVAFTKRDLVTPQDRAWARPRLARLVPVGVPIVEVSARTGEGLPGLRAALVRALTGAAVGPSDLEALARGPVLFTERQRDLVRAAREALRAPGGPARARSYLETLLRGPRAPGATTSKGD